MRGLEELRKINEDPANFFRSRNPRPAARDPEVIAEQRRRHGERVEARQAQNASAKDKTTLHPAEFVADIFFTLLVGALVNSIITQDAEPGPADAPADPVESAKTEPEFTSFFEYWGDLNARRARAGLPEANFGEAKKIFKLKQTYGAESDHVKSDETPLGALVFVGKEWDGTRAVPSEPVTYLGGARPAYHGEYRVETPIGVKWFKVANHNHDPIVYKLPEAALIAAKAQKASQ